MKNVKYIVILVILMVTTGLMNVSAQDSIDFGGYVRNYTGILFNNLQDGTSDNDFASVQNTFDLKADYSGDRADLHAEGYVYADGDTTLSAGIRELYFDLYSDSLDLRIGKQQIIWGKGDGVFITDVVSPKDMSKFIIPDFDEIRLGVTALKADYYLGNFAFEGVWIPVFTPNILPAQDSLWAVSMDFPTGVEPSLSTALPSTTLENSEGFAKVSYMGSAFDFELMGGTMFDDAPTGHVTPVNLASTPKLVDVTKEYQRLLMGGGSFSTEIAGVVMKGEGAYYSGKAFNMSPEALLADLGSGGDGTIEKDAIHYMVGADYVIAGVNLGVQFIQEYILDYNSKINNDEFNSTMTFLTAKNFMDDSLELKFFGYYGLNNEDALLRFSAGYSVTEGMLLTAGVDIFIGDTGYFGQYDANDLGYIQAKYSF